MKLFKKILGLLCAVILILWGALIVYSANYYRADDEKLNQYYPKGNDNYTISVNKNCSVFTTNTDVRDCVIFYPGAKVETRAYIPLCSLLAENGIDCVIVDMPYKLAFLGINSADKVIKTIDGLDMGVENYYICGHSLGGVARANYADKNADKLDGIILLASYSTKNLCDNEIPVLSVYGTNDGVINKDNYEKYKDNISENLTEIVIDGGNHAYFGAYGNQEGDYSADITNDEQLKITADAIIEFINSNK